MRIIIAEDEPLASAKLKLFLEKLGEGKDVMIYDNGIAVAAALQDEQPDILFLDIQMPGLTGMEVLAAGNTNRTQVIITSAYDQYALPAFGFQVTDYLLKPYTMERLRVALEKAKEAIRLRKLDKFHNASTLSIRTEGRQEMIATADILLLESLKDYVRLTLNNGQHRMVLGTMSSFEEQLPEGDFTRVHRSFIINRNAIKAIDGNEITMSNGQVIPVGRTYKKNFSI